MWMHNGGIAEFTRLKRQLQSTLSDELYNFPQGNTGIVGWNESDDCANTV